MSARRPTWSRAVTARAAPIRWAPARRSSAATIGRSTRSIAGVQSLDDRVVLVQARAVDLDDQLGARPVERVALQLLDRLAEHLAVQVPGARAALEAGQRRLVRGAPGADHQPAAAGRAREALRERLLGATHHDPGR